MDRLLIADDEADIVTMLTTFFEGKGYDVMTASDGIETLKQVEKRPDLILLDISCLLYTSDAADDNDRV